MAVTAVLDVVVAMPKVKQSTAGAAAVSTALSEARLLVCEAGLVVVSEV